MFLTDENILVLSEVDSTNNYAKQLIAEKAENGTVVLAHYQSKGRGQQGNYWESEANKNLLFSLIFYPDFLEAGQQFYISKVVSLALAKVLGSIVKGVKVKWPNDVYVHDKKIAGMLIENTIKGAKLDTSVIGIGLNVNQVEFMSDAPNPVSLKQLIQKEINTRELLKNFLMEFKGLVLMLQKGEYKKIDEMYSAVLFRKSGWHLYRRDGDVFEARIAGIGSFGQLQLEDRCGKVTEFMFKEVEFAL